MSKEDHSDAAMFVCVITSHGDRHDIYGSDDIGVNLKKLAGHFKGDKCPSLAGKPKLFFIQVKLFAFLHYAAPSISCNLSFRLERSLVFVQNY